MLRSINRFINDKRFYININNEYINIVNFENIVILEENKVVVIGGLKKFSIKGSNISINKLLDDELLISGNFSSIEIGDQYV